MIRRYGRVALAVLIWAVLCLALPSLAETLNGLKPGGSPLGFELVAAATPLLLLIAAWALGHTGRPQAATGTEGSAP